MKTHPFIRLSQFTQEIRLSERVDNPTYVYIFATFKHEAMNRSSQFGYGNLPLLF